jgi:hypothetical protein
LPLAAVACGRGNLRKRFRVVRVHVTEVPRQMLETIAAELPAPAAAAIRGLLNPRLTDGLLRVLGEPGRAFDPLLHNTVNARRLSWAVGGCPTIPP